MIIAILYILAIFISYNILKTKGWERFVWYLASITLVPTAFNVYSGIALTTSHYFFVFLFFMSVFLEGKLKMRFLKQAPLFTPLLLLFISYILIGITDERVNLFKGVYRGLYNYIIFFGTFFIGWLSSYEKIDYTQFNKFLVKISLIFVLYGVFTFVTRSNPIVYVLGFEGRFYFEDANATFREFLVSGFLLESGVYGLSCFIFLILIWAFTKNIKKKTILALGLLFINIFLSGTRSIIIPSIIGLIIFISIHLNLKNKIQLLFFVLLIFFTATILLPNNVTKYSTEMFNAIVDVISPTGSGGEDLGGSNIDAREMQITAAFVKYLPEKPFFGHGFNYYMEVILPSNNGFNDAELLGMESYLCYLGVEYGLVNIIAVIIFFISLVIYFLKNRRIDRTLYSIGISLTITYIIYLVTAFMGDSWLYALPVIGFIIGLIEQKKYNKEALLQH